MQIFKASWVKEVCYLKIIKIFKTHAFTEFQETIISITRSILHFTNFFTYHLCLTGVFSRHEGITGVL